MLISKRGKNLRTTFRVCSSSERVKSYFSSNLMPLVAGFFSMQHFGANLAHLVSLVASVILTLPEELQFGIHSG